MNERIAAEIFPPGEFLRDELETREWTQTEFAEIIRRPTRLVNEIIAGKRGITPETAKEFAAALGTSAQVWLNLETTYQLSRAVPVSKDIARDAKLRERFPVREMIKRRWIENSPNFEVIEKQVFDFFKIKSIEDNFARPYAAKKGDNDDLTPLQEAWRCRVKNLAESINAPSFSKNNLNSSLIEIEALMEKAEDIKFIPNILKKCGVRFFIVEPIPKSKIDGICFWLNDTSPVIGLTLRLDRIDNFWFTLRHEIEHVLQNDAKGKWIFDDIEKLLKDQSEGRDIPLEEERANKAATDFCVPNDAFEDFIVRHNPIFREKNLLGFSIRNKRHPGIVAGQLSFRTRRYDRFSKYKVKIRDMITPYALTDGYGFPVS